MTVTNDAAREGAAPSPLATGLKLVASALGAIFCAGGAVGAFAAMAEDGVYKPLGIAVTALFAGLAIGLAAVFARQWQRSRAEPVGPRTRRSRTMTIISGAVGGIIGLLLVLGQMQMNPDASAHELMTAPIPGWTAAVLIALLVTVIPWVTWQWHRNVDEHENQAYRDGTVAGIYAYALLSLCWWLAERGGMAPAPDGIVIFFVTFGVWGAVWMWRRLR